MRQDNLEILEDTLNILAKGYYTTNSKIVKLKLSQKQMAEIQVFLPDDIEIINEKEDFECIHAIDRVRIGCENIDSFTLARKRSENTYFFSKGKQTTVLVLNLANPVNPGGGVRRGSKAQEEDLCRKSSLLLSLESQEARRYYDYNRSLNTYMGSDALVITPQVEIIKDEKGNLLEDTVLVSVMTCAAPMLRYGMAGMTDQQYRAMMYRRIVGMLKVAAYLGYEVLVLGAFGCGAFRNDARVVSDLFYKALKEFSYGGMGAKEFFKCIDFAVMDHSYNQYNFNEFCRNFINFYKDEDTPQYMND